MVGSKVFSTREFIEWFARQVSEKMGCPEVLVKGVILHKNSIDIPFLCNGHNYVAKIKRGVKFDVAVYALVYKNGKPKRIIKLSKDKEPSWLFYCANPRKVYGSLDNALFRVAEGVKIKVYESDLYA